MNLERLTTTELIQHAWQQLDSLTSTDLERELINRLEAQQTEIDELRTLAADSEALDDPAEFSKIVALLTEFNAPDAKTLRQKLERADKFYEIAEEAGDVFQRLTTLAEATL